MFNPYIRPSLLRAVLVIYLGAFTMHADAKLNPSNSAAYLVTLMQLDKAMIIGGRGEIVRSIPKEEVRTKFVACTDKADRSAITKLIATQIRHALTGEEIANAIRFYESGPGRKYTERDIRVGEAEGLRIKPVMVEFSAEELAAIERFTKSPAGVKLIINNVAFPDQLITELLPFTQAILGKCARGIREK
jgi:hypothetical protein